MAEAHAVFVLKGECLGHGNGFGDAGGFDEQVVKAAFLCQTGDFFQQVVTEGAANTAVGHLNEFFLSATQFSTTLLDECSVNVHLTHVVHNDSDSSAFTVVEDLIQERGFASAEESGKDGHWKAILLFCYGCSHGTHLLGRGHFTY